MQALPVSTNREMKSLWQSKRKNRKGKPFLSGMVFTVLHPSRTTLRRISLCPIKFTGTIEGRAPTLVFRVYEIRRSDRTLKLTKERVVYEKRLTDLEVTEGYVAVTDLPLNIRLKYGGRYACAIGFSTKTLRGKLEVWGALDYSSNMRGYMRSTHTRTKRGLPVTIFAKSGKRMFTRHTHVPALSYLILR